MHIRNLEVGLRRILVATFRSKGLSQAAAEDKATRSMTEAVSIFHKQLRSPSLGKRARSATTNSAPIRRRADREHQSPARTTGFALHAVRVWAHDLP